MQSIERSCIEVSDDAAVRVSTHRQVPSCRCYVYMSGLNRITLTSFGYSESANVIQSLGIHFRVADRHMENDGDRYSKILPKRRQQLFEALRSSRRNSQHDQI